MQGSNQHEKLLEVVTQRYSKYLDEEQLKKVEDKLKNVIETAEELRAVKLENWDEPFNVFKPYTEDTE